MPALWIIQGKARSGVQVTQVCSNNPWTMSGFYSFSPSSSPPVFLLCSYRISQFPGPNPGNWKQPSWSCTGGMSKWIGGHHPVKNTLGKIVVLGPNPWSEKVEWLLSDTCKEETLVLYPSQWISRSVFRGIYVFLLQNPWSMVVCLGLLSLHILLSIYVWANSVIKQNPGFGQSERLLSHLWEHGNDSHRDVSASFLFAFDMLSLYRVSQTQKKLLSSEKEVLIWAELHWEMELLYSRGTGTEKEKLFLDLNKFLESKICRTILSHREEWKVWNFHLFLRWVKRLLCLLFLCLLIFFPFLHPLRLCYLMSQSGCITCN